jgi:hypothetical protein
MGSFGPQAGYASAGSLPAPVFFYCAAAKCKRVTIQRRVGSTGPQTPRDCGMRNQNADGLSDQRFAVPRCWSRGFELPVLFVVSDAHTEVLNLRKISARATAQKLTKKTYVC